MKDKAIDEKAQEIAHEHTAACRNRPASMSSGHGKACKKLAELIADAMKAARDNT